VNSKDTSGDLTLDLEVAFRSTSEDVRVLRALRSLTPSWLELSDEELDALLPASALDRRPAYPAHRTPFTL
jgi:hypothetical protein